ncbi:carbonic anhydrase 6-like [Bacillus rossius redtenbacheri]|uniref:carbonic anhydrase 6-like n=1 Tax=Bacillus rossius redtenbacheri TaxID=93214 RepID=UPI002FDD850A
MSKTTSRKCSRQHGRPWKETSEELLKPYKLGYFTGLVECNPICHPESVCIWRGVLLSCGTREPRGFDLDETDQRLWSREHPGCGGQLQSPIHLVGHKAVPLPLRALETAGFHDPLPQPRLANTGHSVSLTVERSAGVEVPWVFGAVLDGRYDMEGLHFHWGSRNSWGSEHVLNSIRYPAEMHVIFRSNKYSSVQEAQQHSDGLAVLAFFVQLRQHGNEALSPLLAGLQAVRAEGQSAPVSPGLTLASLLPRDTEVYYTYRGSLTTPPCSQAVVWIVFPECVPASFRQLKQFRRLTAGSRPLVDNYRRVQPLGPRRVLVRRLPGPGPGNHSRGLGWLVEPPGSP